MNRIPVAIVGLGRIASLLEDDSRREKPCTHAGAVTANKDCVLAAGCDTDEERRRLFAVRWQAPVYADALRMLREHKPEILIIATHPDSHERYCRLAYTQGTPVLICEKPLSNTLAGARKIAALTQGRGGSGPSGRALPSPLRILVNHERRYAADYMRAAEILRTRRLGPLLSVRAVLYMGRARPLIDVLWHDGTHLADAIMFLAGAVLRHKGRWGSPLGSKEGTAYLEGLLYPAAGPEGEKQSSPVPCLIEAGAWRDHLVFEMEFSCGRGRLRIGNGVYEVWESAECPYAEGFRSLARSPDRFRGSTGYFANMLADAAACVRDSGRQPRSAAADGLRVIEYLNAVKIGKPENPAPSPAGNATSRVN
ncbi:MAG: Gfo/Idh/MocA family oxidoreductase [Treponema sp.]|jgi:predicted dehydrogenase|nr:Gfo/Idh/MocA family oxidoreductase [Treponema sp.]